MMLFESPPQSRYDLNFSIAGIPVRVHPLFWVIALIFGLSGGVLGMLVWVVVLFVSLLVHELGHALTMRYFGLDASIVLYAGGGLAQREAVRFGSRSFGVALKPAQDVAISLAGPFAGFALALLVVIGVIAAGGTVTPPSSLLNPAPDAILPFGIGILDSVVNALLWANIFWGLVNLAPVMPLDGGQVAQRLWSWSDPVGGARRAMWLSVIAGAIMAVAGLLLWRSTYMAVLFGLLAFQSYQAMRMRY